MLQTDKLAQELLGSPIVARLAYTWRDLGQEPARCGFDRSRSRCVEANKPECHRARNTVCRREAKLRLGREGRTVRVDLREHGPA
jgi:hypothetical protein